MKKIIKMVIIMLLLIFYLTGCESTYYITNEVLENQTDRLIIIKRWYDENGYKNCIVYDKETLVEYWVIYSLHMGGVTVLLDAEGKPVLYKEGE